MRLVRLYLDSFFVSNFWFHFLCLCLLRLFLSERKKHQRKRIVAAAFVCSMADIIGIFLLHSDASEARLLFSAGELVWAVYFSFGKKRICRNTIGLLMMTMLLGGCFSLFKVRNTGLFCFFGGVLFLFVEMYVQKLWKKNTERGYLYETRLSFEGESREYTAYLDTGNRLKLYGSSLPVIVAREEQIEDWVIKSKLLCPQKYICLPFHGVGGKGLLYGVRVDCEITKEQGGCVYHGMAAVVGTQTRLFFGREYELLLQPEFFEVRYQTQNN